jgi:hypothetical protein
MRGIEELKKARREAGLFALEKRAYQQRQTRRKTQ